jgi:type IV secretory pathway VirB9-like protein
MRGDERRASPDLVPAVVAVEKMNFSYTIKGGDQHMRPVRVFDDGAKTYIQMPSLAFNIVKPRFWLSSARTAKAK